MLRTRTGRLLSDNKDLPYILENAIRETEDQCSKE